MVDNSRVSELVDASIKEFFETASLYSWRRFVLPAVNRSDIHIPQIDDVCEHCDERRPFRNVRVKNSRLEAAAMGGRALGSGTSNHEFKCVSCNRASREFFVELVIHNREARIQKYGELPRKKLPRDPKVQKFLRHDLDNYEKAIICMANSYGIAAFAYYRRVIENNINLLIELVEEDAKASSSSEETVSAIESLKSNSPMSEKIKVANIALPEYLKPEGLNPLGKLYQVLSEGVHNYTDEECQVRAHTLDDCLGYLISELASRKTNREAFKRSIGTL